MSIQISPSVHAAFGLSTVTNSAFLGVTNDYKILMSNLPIPISTFWCLFVTLALALGIDCHCLFGGEHGALSCSSAEGRQARGWRQQPHSAQSGSGARWPLAALPEHPSPPRPRSAEPLGLAASRVHLPEEHAGVPRHKKPSGSAGTAHPTGMRAGPHNPGQKDRLTSLSSLLYF